MKATITVEQDSDPFANAFPGYLFGLVDEKVEPQVETFDDSTTDGKGQASFDMTPTDLPDTPQPLKATLRTEVYEFGGRPVIKSLTLPVRNKPIFLGIKPQFGDDAVASGVDAGFEVIAVNKAGGDGRGQWRSSIGWCRRIGTTSGSIRTRIGTTRSSPATSRRWRRASWI